jgi:cytochrome b
MSLAFAASAGSMLALTGSPVNVIVSEAAAASGHHGFGYLSFAWLVSRLCWGRSRSCCCPAGVYCPSVMFGRCRRISASTRGRSRNSTKSTRRSWSGTISPKP